MTICIFGDSITWGAIDCEKGGWAERLKMHLLSTQDDVWVHNLGIPDDSADDVIKRLESEAEARNPDVIIFAIGMNDAYKYKGEKRTPIEEFRKNIEILTSKAKRITDKIAFVGLTNVDESKTDPYPWDENISSSNEDIAQYDDAIEFFCKNNNLPYVEMIGVLDNEDLCDGLHPTPEGHEKMFQKIEKEIGHLWKE